MISTPMKSISFLHKNAPTNVSHSYNHCDCHLKPRSIRHEIQIRSVIRPPSVFRRTNKDSKDRSMDPRPSLRSTKIMLIFTAITFLHAVSESFASDNQPNIVIILADDLGWNAVGYHNSRMETPNIDRIVSEGMELDRFYVAPMCSPTRAGLLTGRYPIRYGCARAVIPPQRDFGLPLKEITLAETLKDHGYENRGIFGKWHLGHRRTKWHPLCLLYTSDAADE